MDSLLSIAEYAYVANRSFCWYLNRPLNVWTLRSESKFCFRA
jgi:hypothetical protein